MIREAKEEDLPQLLELYLDLHDTALPEPSAHLDETWHQILADPNYHLIVCEVAGVIVSSLCCMILPNLPRGVRPYAFLENMVTHHDHRGKGYATACLNYAREIAISGNCYKLMLMTGSKDPGTLRLYENAGYHTGEKTAFVQWLL